MFIAPVLLGGDAVSIGGKGVASVAEGYRLKEIQSKQFESDLFISGKVKDYKKAYTGPDGVYQRMLCVRMCEG